MTIVIPDARTPAGVRCWVREFDGYAWLPRVYAGCGQDQYRVRTDGIGQEHWRLCRLDDPVEGWVENTGTAPDVKVPIEIKLRSGAVSCLSNVGASIAFQWRIYCVSSDITHWRYPRTETKEPEMKQQQTLMQFDPATGVERPAMARMARRNGMAFRSLDGAARLSAGLAGKR